MQPVPGQCWMSFSDAAVSGAIGLKAVNETAVLVSAYREAALAMAGLLSEPIDVVFDIGDCVLFPPVEVLDEYELLQN